MQTLLSERHKQKNRRIGQWDIYNRKDERGARFIDQKQKRRVQSRVRQILPQLYCSSRGQKNKWFQENSKDVLQKIKITPNALDLFISKTYVHQQMPMICKKKSSQKTKKSKPILDENNQVTCVEM